MVRNIFWGRYRLSLSIIPKDLEILFDIFCICASHMLINGQPKKIKILHSHYRFPFNSNSGMWLIISRWWLWNITYFVFSTFSDDLFNWRHFCISFSSLFITCERDTILSGVFCFLLKEPMKLVKFVSSAKKDWMEMVTSSVNIIHINNEH